MILSIFVLFIFGTTVCLPSQNEKKSYEHILAIPVERDAHGKFVIDGDALEKTSGYEEKFTEFVNHIKQAHPLMPIIVSLSVDKPHPELRAFMAPFQFVMYHTDNPRQKVEWIFRNGRKVPDPDTTAVGTNVMCVKLDTKAVILIKDHQKNFLSVPGGYVDRGETSLMAATRECKEEINLTVDPDKIKLAGLF